MSLGLWLRQFNIGTFVHHDIGSDFAASAMTAKDARNKFKRVDDKKIIKDNTLPWGIYAMYVVLPLIFSYSILFEGEYAHLRSTLTYIVSGSGILCSIWALIYWIFLTRKIVIFDRTNGTITIGAAFWKKPITIPFKDVRAFARTEYTYYASDRVLNVYRPDFYKQDVAIHSQNFGNIASDWVFYVWYMDKTRELPPGEAFDQFREADNKRRLSELKSP